ncbi:MAG: protein-L-isoaspartate O-methyltransferase family protein, partial [Thermoleophilaceae bacterium]
MVERQLRRRGIHDERVLGAMAEVPRELFVPEDLRRRAYRDGALRIGEGQTISQPWIVACMA